MLHALDRDPGGHSNVLDEYPEQAATLKEIASELGLGRVPEPSGGTRRRELSTELREKLRALGYVDEIDGYPTEPEPTLRK